MAAATTGISSRAQRCLTSCIFVCFGRRSDPLQRILQELITIWLKLMPIFYLKPHFDLSIAWSSAKQAVVKGLTPSNFQQIETVQLRWKKITGPVSNMVASLYMIGWNPVSFSEWVQPDGTTWSLPTSSFFLFHPPHVVRAAQDQAASMLWKPAGLHYNGAGLSDGLAFSYSMHVLHSYRKMLAYDKSAALETIMCAACWSPQRKFDVGLISDDLNVCSMCHITGCDDYH